jgi:hypothetical protein
MLCVTPSIHATVPIALATRDDFSVFIDQLRISRQGASLSALTEIKINLLHSV